MKKILAIAWKDTRLRFSSRSELLFFIVLPLLFTVIISGAYPGNADNRIAVLVVDEDGSALASDWIAALSSSTALRPSVLPRAEAEQQFAERGAPALVTLPPGFEVRLLAGEPVSLEARTLPNNTNVLAVEQAIRSANSAVSRALLVARNSVVEAEQVRPFASEADRAAYFAQSLDAARSLFASAPRRVETVTAALAGATFDGRAQTSAGQLITWVFIPLLGTSAMFAIERAQGTLRRLLTSPTRSATYLAGTILGQLGGALVQMVLLVGFGVLALGVNYGRSLDGLTVLLFAFALASVAFGVMLATFVKTPGQANGLSIMLGMVMGLLGGCWYPLEAFPEAVRTLVHVLPTTWAMQGMTDIAVRGQGLVDILPEAGVLLAFAAVFFVIGVRRFRFE